MEPAILTGNTLKLPERIARRLKGKRIQITEVEEGILLRATDHPIAEAKGFLKGKGFSIEQRIPGDEKNRKGT